MSDTMTLQIGQRGVLTLPKSLREHYRLKAGDSFTLLDLGGVFLLTPSRSEIDALADNIAQALIERGETLESMLKAVREAREGYAEPD